MKQVIEQIEVIGGTDGNRLKVIIPLGMSGVKLKDWKRRNQEKITAYTSVRRINAAA